MVLRAFHLSCAAFSWVQRRPRSHKFHISSSTAVRFSRCVICVLQPLPPLDARVFGARNNEHLRCWRM
jgi:hypothetical protein